MDEQGTGTTAEDAARALLVDFARDLERRQRENRAKRQTIWKPTATSATQLGWECERRVVYQRVVPWDAAPIPDELASIFFEGTLHERQVVQEIENDLGLRLRERSATFRDERLDLVGQLDFEVFVEGVGWVPTEVKGLQVSPGEDEHGDELANGSPLLRRYHAQILTYLVLRAKGLGLLIVKNKGTGLWRVLVVSLDYGRAEQLLRRAERVRDAVKAYKLAFATVRPFSQDGPDRDAAPGLHVADEWDRALDAAEPTLPNRLIDRSECPRCPFKARCNPSQSPVDPALLIDDEFLINKIRRHEAAKPARGEYNRVHEELYERFKLTAGTVFFAGTYRITKKPHGKSFVMKIENQDQGEKANDEDDAA